MKKQVLFLAVLTALTLKSSVILAQEPSRANQDTNIGKEVFMLVEVQPQFPGGEKALPQFLADNIQYPEKAKTNNIQGTVLASFIVETDGTISNLSILRGIGSGCDEEVIRVLKKMPKWKAGVQRGKNVRVKINIPVKFMFEK
jgi:periplasmic protein TonB